VAPAKAATFPKYMATPFNSRMTSLSLLAVAPSTDRVSLVLFYGCTSEPGSIRKKMIFTKVAAPEPGQTVGALRLKFLNSIHFV
jgi:hypothetical protein